jgi:hypothetical protein
MPKTFSDYALEEIDDVFANHSNHVGSVLKRSDPAKYAAYIASDCITFVIWVLQHAFRETGNPIAADKVGTLGAKGTDLAKYLIDQHHWHGVYYNPDVNHPSDGSGEHIVSYYKQVKAKCKYSVAGVPVQYKLINYRPSGIQVSPGLPLTTQNLEHVPVALGRRDGPSRQHPPAQHVQGQLPVKEI